jgi:pimeloyl-ACP methyl ester carboxylesterase
MGGMLAARFARLFPDRVERLLLAGPIGLEDYSKLVPARPIETIVEEERKFSRDAYRAFLLKGYAWKGKPEELDDFVDIRERLTYSGEYPRWVKAFAWSAVMIHGQPVVGEMPQIQQPTLILMGSEDRVAPGRNLAPPDVAARMGRNAELAKEVAGRGRDL